MDEFASREMREMRLLPARLARLARDFAIIFVRESFFAAAAAGIATRASGVAAIVILTTTPLPVPQGPGARHLRRRTIAPRRRHVGRADRWRRLLSAGLR